MAGDITKPFLLRIDRRLLAALQRLASDDLRSLNAEIEWILREALRKRGRLPGSHNIKHGFMASLPRGRE